jgi:lysozyme
MKPYLIILGFSLFFFACKEQTERKHDFSVHGIDVSHYQKKIDWKKVADQDIQFAFIKATEGETYKDSFFCENWMEMKAANIKRGAYHFFRPTLSPELQAINFIETAELGHGDFYPVIDLEVTDEVSSEELREKVNIWLSIIEGHYKVKPIIYTYQNFFNDHLAGYYKDYPIWIARYTSWWKPRLCAGQDWQFWQYGNRGRLQGIDGNVDFNVFHGTSEELENYCIVRPEPLFIPPPVSEELVAANP